MHRGFYRFRFTRQDSILTRIAEYLNVKYEIAIKPLRYPESSHLLRVSWSLSIEVEDMLFLAEKLDEALEFFGQHAL